MLLYLISILLLCSCSFKQKEAGNETIPEFPPARLVELDSAEGYKIQTLTGEPIRPIRNSEGAELTTGESLPITGREIKAETVTPTAVILARKPARIPAHQNRHKIPENLTFKTYEFFDLREKSLPGQDPSSFVLLNSTGDTLPTGIPIPIEGRVVKGKQAPPMETREPGIKDNAIVDIKYLDVYHGLISSQVISLMEDRRGNIWLGFTGGGAGRYDGKQLTHFSGEAGLSESWITCMLEDSRGMLWFGSLGEGLIQYDGKTFTHFTEKEGMSNNTVQSLTEDSSGNLWIGTAGGGLSRYDGQNLIHYTIREGLASMRVRSLLEDQEGNLWVGTSRGLCMYNGKEFRHFTSTQSAEDYPVTALHEDREGHLWIGTSGGGAMMYNGDSLICFTQKEGLIHNNIETILEDKYGKLWFGTGGGGACMYSQNSFMHLSTEQGLSGNWIIAMLEDSSGNIWFGSVGDGVSIYNSQKFKHFTDNEGLSSRAIYSMLEDSQGNLWYGTMFGGVSKFDGNSYTHYTQKEGLAYHTVESLLEDKEGNLWFGLGAGGVCKFDGQTFTHFDERTGFTEHSVGSMLEDRNGMLWFGTYGGGVIKYNGLTFTHFTQKEGLSNNLVESLLEDDQGNLWIGTLGGGVSRFDGQNITHFSEKEGLSSNLIGSLMQDRQGRIWIGTMTGGICILSGNQLHIITETEGLSDNHIQSMVQDGSGKVWVGTDKGLDLIGSYKGSYPAVIRSFGVQDGLKGIHFLQNSVLLDDQNQLWWGTNKCLSMLDLDRYSWSQKTPVVRLNRIDINGAFVDYLSPEGTDMLDIRYREVSRFSNYPTDLKLPYNRNHLTFHFTAVDWSAPHKLKYSYRILGLDESWSLPSSDVKAEYRNLPAGTHSFEVKALGESNIWSDPLVFSFTITPPWWQSWWSRAGYGILTALLILGIVRWRTANLKKRQKELEHIVSERTIEISDKNEELQLQNQNLALQRDEIQNQKKAITDSIEYARRIQTATLPPDDLITRLIPDHFILYKPLQIVSGDFYWVKKVGEKVVVAVADCTGHGVPGAFMSMLGSALLNDIVSHAESLQAHLILNELRDQVIASLRQTGEADEARDGMDIGLCIIDWKNKELQFSGAHNPLFHIRNGELQEIKADRMPIGISSEARSSFTKHQIKLRENDLIYMFTDGYVDQLGGDKRKKFLKSRLKTILAEIWDKNLPEQQDILKQNLHSWMEPRGNSEARIDQIDDILVMGIRIDHAL